MNKISCVLITRESQYPSLVMERLNLGFFDEILVSTNSPSIFQRYQLAQDAKNEVIYVQDDDCMVNYQVLFGKYNLQITNSMTLPFQKQYEQLDCTLVGWGCFFPKWMIQVFDKYVATYGENDPHLLREADRIFTYLNRPFNTIIMPHEDLPRANADISMWRESSHWTSAKEAIEKAKILISNG